MSNISASLNFLGSPHGMRHQSSKSFQDKQTKSRTETQSPALDLTHVSKVEAAQRSHILTGVQVKTLLVEPSPGKGLSQQEQAENKKLRQFAKKLDKGEALSSQQQQRLAEIAKKRQPLSVENPSYTYADTVNQTLQTGYVWLVGGLKAGSEWTTYRPALSTLSVASQVGAMVLDQFPQTKTVAQTLQVVAAGSSLLSGAIGLAREGYSLAQGESLNFRNAAASMLQVSTGVAGISGSQSAVTASRVLGTGVQLANLMQDPSIENVGKLFLDILAKAVGGNTADVANTLIAYSQLLRQGADAWQRLSTDTPEGRLLKQVVTEISAQVTSAADIQDVEANVQGILGRAMVSGDSPAAKVLRALQAVSKVGAREMSVMLAPLIALSAGSTASYGVVMLGVLASQVSVVAGQNVFQRLDRAEGNITAFYIYSNKLSRNMTYLQRDMDQTQHNISNFREDLEIFNRQIPVLREGIDNSTKIAVAAKDISVNSAFRSESTYNQTLETEARVLETEARVLETEARVLETEAIVSELTAENRELRRQMERGLWIGATGLAVSGVIGLGLIGAILAIYLRAKKTANLPEVDRASAPGRIRDLLETWREQIKDLNEDLPYLRAAVEQYEVLRDAGFLFRREYSEAFFTSKNAYKHKLENALREVRRVSDLPTLQRTPEALQTLSECINNVIIPYSTINTPNVDSDLRVKTGELVEATQVPLGYIRQEITRLTQTFQSIANEACLYGFRALAYPGWDANVSTKLDMLLLPFDDQDANMTVRLQQATILALPDKMRALVARRTDLKSHEQDDILLQNMINAEINKHKTALLTYFEEHDRLINESFPNPNILSEALVLVLERYRTNRFLAAQQTGSFQHFKDAFDSLETLLNARSQVLTNQFKMFRDALDDPDGGDLGGPGGANRPNDQNGPGGANRPDDNVDNESVVYSESSSVSDLTVEEEFDDLELDEEAQSEGYVDEEPVENEDLVHQQDDLYFDEEEGDVNRRQEHREEYTSDSESEAEVNEDEG